MEYLEHGQGQEFQVTNSTPELVRVLMELHLTQTLAPVLLLFLLLLT